MTNEIFNNIYLWSQKQLFLSMSNIGENPCFYISDHDNNITNTILEKSKCKPL